MTGINRSGTVFVTAHSMQFQNQAVLIISASEISEYIYCELAWVLSRNKQKEKSSNTRAQEKGQQYHWKHHLSRRFLKAVEKSGK